VGIAKFGLTFPTGNRKVGGKTGRLAATSITSRASCPSACPFLGKTDCYAENHWSKQVWNRVDDAGIHLDEFVARLRLLPKHIVWRHNVSGDLPHTNQQLDAKSLMRIVRAGAHLRGFTYTHHVLNAVNVRILRIARANGFTVNASANDAAHADRILDEHPDMPVVTIVPTGTGKHSTTPAGRKIVTCPADYRDDWDCARCGENAKGLPLCAQADRGYLIGFIPKGARKKSVSTRATIGASA